MRATMLAILLAAAPAAYAGERALVATQTLVPRTHTITLPDKVGILRAVDERRLGFPVGGRLDTRVEEGARVEAGELIAQLDDALERAQVEQAEIRLREARSELRRAQQLHEASAQSGRVLEHSEHEAQLRRAELDIARERLAQRRIEAPFGGVAVDVQAEPGEILAPAAPVVTFMNLDVLRLELGVPGSQVAQIEEGAAAEVALIGRDTEPVQGVVYRVAAAAVDGSHHFEVEVHVESDAGRLRPGMTARTRLVVGTHESALLVPLESVVERDGEPLVFFVDGAEAVAVPIGRAVRDGDVFVLSDETPLRDLVVRGQRDLRAGTPVRVDNSVLVGAAP